MHGKGYVNCALGPVAADALGQTLVHEHLFYAWPGFEHDRDVPMWAHRAPEPALQVDRAGLVEHLVRRAKELVDLGVSTLVDPCPIEMGRNPEIAAEVSEKSGLNIVVATGNFMEFLGLPMYFKMRPVDELADIYRTEIESGIGNTGVKAGVIKTASGGVEGLTSSNNEPSITPFELNVHHAAGQVSAATGAPIVCHNDERLPAGRQQLAIFAEEGVRPEQVMIGHADAVGDMRYYFDILDAGAFLGFDRWGGLPMAPEKLRIASFVGLHAVGYTDQLLISSDSLGGWIGRREPGITAQQDTYGDWNWTHVVKRVIPWLRDAGVPQESLDRLLTVNARRWLTGT